MPWETGLIRVAVGILQREGKVLVAERPEGKPYASYWEFPGGKIEANESSDDALKRELHEELGIEVKTANFWFDHVHRYPEKTVFLEMWLVTEFSGEPYGKEQQQLCWVTFPEMLALRLLEGNLFIIDRIKLLLNVSSV